MPHLYLNLNVAVATHTERKIDVKGETESEREASERETRRAGHTVSDLTMLVTAKAAAWVVHRISYNSILSMPGNLTAS